MGLIKWFVDKKIRNELDDLFSEIKKLKASMEAMETNMTSLRGAFARAKLGKQKGSPSFSSESESPAPRGMTREMQEWIQGTLEYKSGMIPKTETINNEEDEED